VGEVWDRVLAGGVKTPLGYVARDLHSAFDSALLRDLTCASNIHNGGSGLKLYRRPLGRDAIELRTGDC